MNLNNKSKVALIVTLSAFVIFIILFFFSNFKKDMEYPETENSNVTDNAPDTNSGTEVYSDVTVDAASNTSNQTSEQKYPSQSAVEEESTVAEAGIDFPYVLENGKLTVESVFDYAEISTDNSNSSKKIVPAMEVCNISAKHLKSAELILILKNGKKILFTVEDLPKQKSAIIFSEENISLDSEGKPVKIESSAEFTDEDVLMSDSVKFNANGTDVTVTNLTDKDINNLSVNCHCVFAEKYFGGLAYKYKIDNLEAGKSFTVKAVECFKGYAEVTSINVLKEEEK